MNYVYFVSFITENIIGNGQITSHKAITDIDQVREIENSLKEKHGKYECKLTNYILMRVDQ